MTGRNRCRVKSRKSDMFDGSVCGRLHLSVSCSLLFSAYVEFNDLCHNLNRRSSVGPGRPSPWSIGTSCTNFKVPRFTWRQSFLFREDSGGRESESGLCQKPLPTTPAFSQSPHSELGLQEANLGKWDASVDDAMVYRLVSGLAHNCCTHQRNPEIISSLKQTRQNSGVIA